MGANAVINGIAYFKNKKLTDQRDADLNTLIEKNEAEYQEGQNDFMDSAVAKSITRGLTDQLTEQAQVNANKAAATGATAESRVAGNAALNKALTQGFSQIAGMGTQHMENVRNRYDRKLTELSGRKDAILQQKQDSLNNLTENTAGLTGSLLDFLHA